MSHNYDFDLIAIGAMKCLRKAGIEMPRQVSIVGFDDIPAAAYCTPWSLWWIPGT